MTRSKKTTAHYRARMMGLAVVMSAASLGTPGAQALYPSPGERYATKAQTSIHKQPPRAGTAPVSIALERAAAKAWAPVPCAPKARAT